jgi:hydrogenase nickel incorporation protein HypA/HybF
MHELTLAKCLIDLVSEEAADKGASRVTRIHVRLGVLAGIMRSLYTCYTTAIRGTICEGAILELEEVPLTVHCPACDEVKAPRGLYSFRCPDCGTATHEVVTGREMQLVSIELDYDDLTAPSAPPRAASAPTTPGSSLRE